jgi:hypothetical protein
MSNNEDIRIRLEELKSIMYNEIHQLINDSKRLNNSEKDIELKKRLQKFKPSKHKMAYRVENNFKKRCYAR